MATAVFEIEVELVPKIGKTFFEVIQTIQKVCLSCVNQLNSSDIRINLLTYSNSIVCLKLGKMSVKHH